MRVTPIVQFNNINSLSFQKKANKKPSNKISDEVRQKRKEELKQLGQSKKMRKRISLWKEDNYQEIYKFLGQNPDYEDRIKNKELRLTISKLPLQYNLGSRINFLVKGKPLDANESEMMLVEKTVDSDGQVFQQTTYFPKYRGSYEATVNDSSQYIISNTKGDFGSFYTKADETALFEVIKVVADKETGELKGVKHSILNDCNLYDTTYYDLKDYPEDMDIIEEIKNGTITGGKKLSETKKYKSGKVVYYENIDYEGSKIYRKYLEKKNKKGEIVKSIYKYTITDEKGKVLLNNNRKYEQIGKNKFKTTVNGQWYIVEYDDENKIIHLQEEHRSASMYAKKVDGDNNDLETLWGLLKSLPGDTISYIYRNQIELQADDESKFYGSYIKINGSVDQLAHELGHHIDYLKGISNSKKLLKIYKQEMDEFRNNFTDESGIKYFTYFTEDFGGDFPSALDKLNKKTDTIPDKYPKKYMEKYPSGLEELVAETNMILTIPVNYDDDCITRAQLLARYFPKTVSCIAKKINKDN